MKTCIKHVLFLGSPHARVKFGRATGVFPLLASRDHSHLTNFLYLYKSCIKLSLPFALSALLLWHLAVILGVDLGYRNFKVHWMGLGKVFWHAVWTQPSPNPDPSPLCAQKHPRSPETPQLFCGSTNENKGSFKVGKKNQTWLKHSQINQISPCLLYRCRTSPFVQQPLTAPY